jgi:hypothetical protein
MSRRGVGHFHWTGRVLEQNPAITHLPETTLGRRAVKASRARLSRASLADTRGRSAVESLVRRRGRA